MAAQRSVSIDRLWNDFLKTFPYKDRSSDGWIGDAAHQQESSGHNPDDTPGVTAERSDADSKQEVRAIDEDSDLRDPRGITMQQVIDRMLQTPNDLKRLIYIIFNRQIWKKSNGWKKETYTGSSPHTEHGHFSGDPAFDEDGSEWTSVTSFKEDDDMANTWTEPLTQGNPGFAGHQRDTALAFAWESAYQANEKADEIKSQLSAMNTTMTAILDLLKSGGGDIDTATVIAHMDTLAQQELSRDNALKQENKTLLQRLSEALKDE